MGVQSSGGMTNPAGHVAAIVKSDSASLAVTSRGIYVGTTGDVAVVTPDGSTAVFTAVPAGSVIPIRAKMVLSATTTASNMTALS